MGWSNAGWLYDDRAEGGAIGLAAVQLQRVLLAERLHGVLQQFLAVIRHGLALLWQIYSCRCLLQIHFRQCGHRRGGSRAMSSRMAWRTAGRVGWGGGPLILFFPPCCCEAAMLEEGVRDHRHERMTV
jgi:hypothetical protein